MALMELSQGAFDDGNRHEIWASAIALSSHDRAGNDMLRHCEVPLGRIVATPPRGDGVALAVGTLAAIASGKPDRGIFLP